MGFCTILAACQRNVFLEKFYVFAFQGHQKPSKAMSKVRTIFCCSKYHENDFRY